MRPSSRAAWAAPASPAPAASPSITARRRSRPAARWCAAGEVITIDGATGEIFLGYVAMIEPKVSGHFGIMMSWADDVRTLAVRTNAETPLDAETAKRFGAEGIGLCRTEHMFFDPTRIGAVRQMIMAVG